jgi:NAD(P)-dependent dehydrogenase (short-subunit alcohol dehydrogenase family)
LDAKRFAVVTGAAGGIGQALVRRFHAAGYAVIATDRAARPDELRCHSYHAIDLARTVTDEAYATDALAGLRAELGTGGLHVLVNNAATQILGGVASLNRADWRATLNTNLLAPFFLTQALVDMLERAQGSVVNISSIHARLTKANFVAYSTSKAALSGMTRAMAVDLGNRVRVNAIEPAAIATEMLKAGFVSQPELYARLEGCHPQGRVGVPEEVAELTLSLTQGGLRFVHGACIGIDGGIGNRLHDPDGGLQH